MAFEKREWESSFSPLPYYMGDWSDAVPTGELSPGIYVVKNCYQVGPPYQHLQELGWGELMVMLGLRALRESSLDIAPATCVEPFRPYHGELFAGAAASIFGTSPVPNRLYRTLPRIVADALMTVWVSNSLTERCERVGVAMCGEEPVGFVTVRRLSAEVEQIDLLGVRPEFRGQGWGRTLAGWAVDTMQTPYLQVRTERDNLAALAAYMSAGFTGVEGDTLFWTRVEEN